ncbi:MAG TPA: hypothetical protein VFR67_10445 [Pilimelia sp.]|nr:hypothetical protein [Pilimelia sp.]
MRGWWHRTRRRLRRRARRMVGIAVLLAVSAALLAWARVSEGFNSDLLLNIGASVVIVALSYAIFDPIFEELRKSRVQEHPAFDHDEFSERVAGASDVVAVMDTGNHMLEGGSRIKFLAAVRVALDRGAIVRILLLDPDSAAASQRAEEIAPVDVRRVITHNLRHLYVFAASLEANLRPRMQVRIYDASPSIQMFRWDDKALISFFPIGIRASAAPHLEVFLASPLGDFVQGRFDDLWRHPSTRELDDHMVVPVAVHHRGELLRSCGVPFIHVGGLCFIDGSPMIDQLTDHGSGQLEIVTTRPLTVGGWSGTVFRLARVDGDSVPDRAGVLALFEAKYGPRQQEGPGRARLALRLVPYPDQVGPAAPADAA